MNTIETHSTSQLTDLSAGAWRLDPSRSSVEFHVRHLWGLATVKGRFETYDGLLDVDVDPAIVLTIDASSVQTGNGKRDQHLRSADFFDAEQHPHVRFVSESVALDGDTMTVRGRLHARGNSIPLDIDAQIRRTDGELEIEAVTTAAHPELGMSCNPARMIRPYSQLIVKGHLAPTPSQGV